MTTVAGQAAGQAHGAPSGLPGKLEHFIDGAWSPPKAVMT